MEEEKSVFLSLNIGETEQTHLASIAKWHRFLAIAGIVGCVIGLASIVATAIYFSTEIQHIEPIDTYVGLLFFALCIVVYLIPCIFRLGFANKMLKAVADSDQYLLSESLKRLLVYSKYLGIGLIIAVSLSMLLIVISLLVDFQKMI